MAINTKKVENKINECERRIRRYEKARYEAEMNGEVEEYDFYNQLIHDINIRQSVMIETLEMLGETVEYDADMEEFKVI